MGCGEYAKGSGSHTKIRLKVRPGGLSLPQGESLRIQLFLPQAFLSKWSRRLRMSGHRGICFGLYHCLQLVPSWLALHSTRLSLPTNLLSITVCRPRCVLGPHLCGDYPICNPTTCSATPQSPTMAIFKENWLAGTRIQPPPQRCLNGQAPHGSTPFFF